MSGINHAAMKNRYLFLSVAFSLFLSGCNFSTSVDTDTGTTPDETTTSVETDSMVTVSGAQVDYTVEYDSEKWIVTPAEATADTEYEFEHVDGDVYAMIIPERIEVSLNTLKDAALENAQAVAPDAEITYEEKKTVNGVDLLALKMTGTIYGTEFVYYGYYYGGSAGTIQFITYTTGNLMSEYEVDLLGLLNGLTITEK